MVEGLLDVLGEPEIECTGEELAATVHPPGGDQLTGPDDAQALVQLRPDEVLAAFSPREREVRRLGSRPPGEGSQ